jgi:hypothetical protein
MDTAGGFAGGHNNPAQLLASHELVKNAAALMGVASSRYDY